MTSIAQTAIGGLFKATEKLAQATQAVVNAPRTGGDVTAALVDAKTSVIDYKANAAVVKLDHERTRALLDIVV